MKYELRDPDGETVFLKDIGELTDLAMEMAEENEMEATNSGDWKDFVKEGKPASEKSFFFSEIKEDIVESSSFSLASEILGVVGYQVFALYEKYKIRIVSTEAIIGGLRDQDQYFTQLATGTWEVSEFEASTLEGEVICYFGSEVTGEQEVYVKENDDGELIPWDSKEGDSTRLWGDPEVLIEAKRKELASVPKAKYLDYSENSWLTVWIKNKDGVDLGEATEEMEAITEDFIHGRVEDMKDLEKGVFSDVVEAIKVFEEQNKVASE